MSKYNFQLGDKSHSKFYLFSQYLWIVLRTLSLHSKLSLSRAVGEPCMYRASICFSF